MERILQVATFEIRSHSPVLLLSNTAALKSVKNYKMLFQQKRVQEGKDYNAHYVFFLLVCFKGRTMLRSPRHTGISHLVI